MVEPYTSETFARLENERFRQEAGPLVEKTKEFLDTIVEAKEFWAGNHYPLEQVLLQVGYDWESLSPMIKDKFLSEVGEYLGIDLLNPPKDQLIRQYEMEGVSETPTAEMTAAVQVFPTQFPEIELHRAEYPEPVGVRYSLFSTSTF